MPVTEMRSRRRNKAGDRDVMAEDLRKDVRVGTAGWAIPRAEAERFAGEGAHLVRYARTLDCAEINATFYRQPRVSTMQRWRDAVPAGFRFSVKAPKSVTHTDRLRVGAARGELTGFLRAIGELGETLGPMLFQLPPRLEFEEGVAEEFLRVLREETEGGAVLEPRHASWFAPEVDDLLATYKVARAAADPARASVLGTEPGGWPGLVYFRLHGSPRIYYSAYGEEFLEELAGRMLSVAAEEVWCVFDNTASGAAAGDALALTRMLRRLM